jgi:hypothetical protein
MSAKKEIVQAQATPLAAPNPEAAQILDIVSRAASDPNVDIDKLERLMDMHERIVNKQAETEFNKAMNAAQNEMRRVAPDSRNSQTHSDYASYAALDRVLRPIYVAHGFSLSFDTDDGAPEQHVRVVCNVSHCGGFSRVHHIDMPTDGKGAKGGDVMTKTHATGSGTQYGMRYLLKMIFNVAIGSDDDDGNAASEATITEKQRADLAALIEEVDANKKAFLKVCGVTDLEHLPASKFHGAVKRLESKRKQ